MIKHVFEQPGLPDVPSSGAVSARPAILTMPRVGGEASTAEGEQLSRGAVSLEIEAGGKQLGDREAPGVGVAAAQNRWDGPVVSAPAGPQNPNDGCKFRRGTWLWLVQAEALTSGRFYTSDSSDDLTRGSIGQSTH